MGEIFGAVGSIAAAAMQADAVKSAAKMQVDALDKQREFVYSELEPGKLNAQATAADVDRAKSRLALQAITDPALLAARNAASEQILKGVEDLGAGQGDQIASMAAKEAITQGETGVAAQMKQRLIDQAISELDAGASLPGDVQAELMKAGLERTGMVQGSANPAGLGGNIARKMIGERALQLKSERQGRAVALTDAAQALEQNRNALLANLFPNLKNTQLANIQGASNALNASASELPEAGLSGESVANIWLARVGATNQLAQSSADAAAKSALGQAQAWNTGMGAATQYGARALPSTASVWGNIFGPSTPQAGDPGTLVSLETGALVGAR